MYILFTQFEIWHSNRILLTSTIFTSGISKYSYTNFAEGNLGYQIFYQVCLLFEVYFKEVVIEYLKRYFS